MPVSPRLAALSGAAGILLFDVAWFWDPAAPFLSDRRLSAWYAGHGNGAWLLAGLLTLLSAPFFLVFAGVVRDRMRAAGASERSQRVVYGAGKGFGIAVLVFGPVYAAIPAARAFTDVGAPSGDVSRFTGSAEFAVWMVLSAALAGVFILGLSVSAFTSRTVPRWLGVAGFLLAVPTLANPVLPMAGITLWFLVTSITLAVSSPRATTPAPAAHQAPSLPLGVPTM